MKKSEMYRQAAKAVIASGSISMDGKVEILKVLFADEELELYREQTAEKSIRTENEAVEE